MAAAHPNASAMSTRTTRGMKRPFHDEPSGMRDGAGNREMRRNDERRSPVTREAGAHISGALRTARAENVVGLVGGPDPLRPRQGSGRALRPGAGIAPSRRGLLHRADRRASG